MGLQIAQLPLIDNADVESNILLHTQDVNNPTGGSPLGASKGISIEQISNEVKSKAIVIPAGTVQADATPLNASDNIADVVAVNSGVILTSSDIGYEAQFFNNGANGCEIYPELGSNFQGEADNDPITIAPNNTFLLKIYEFGEVRVFVI